MERGVLAEARFVREDERPILALGFFLDLGRFACAIGPTEQGQPAQEYAAVSARRNLSGSKVSARDQDDT